MTKNILLKSLFIFFLALSNLSGFISSSLACTGYDIQFISIKVTDITKSTYNYEFKIKNVGTLDIPVNKISIQNYVSSTTSKSGAGAAGGAYIDYSSSVIISPGAEYTGIFAAYPFPANDIKNYPYLVAELSLAGLTDCDNTNNIFFKCLRPDATVNNIEFQNVQPGSVDFTSDILNSGADTLFLNLLDVYFYLSHDNTLDGSDVSAGTSTASSFSTDYVLTGKDQYIPFTASASNIQSYSYLITKLIYNAAECNSVNKVFASSIPALTNIKPIEGSSTELVIWNTETKSFKIQKWNNNASSIEYKLFNSSGVLMQSGIASMDEATSVAKLTSGIYILTLSDGQTTYSKRIVY